MGRYYSHPPAAVVPSYYTAPVVAYERPLPHPRGLGFRFRILLAQVIGLTIIVLGIWTLFLGNPKTYFSDIEIPAKVITPKPFPNLFGSADSPPAPASAPQEPMPAMTAPSPEPVMKTPTPPPPVAPAVKGMVVVQLLASPDLRATKNFYYDMKGRYPTLFSNLTPGIQNLKRLNLYRLYVFPFDGYSDAKSFCRELKTQGEDCFAKRR